MAATVIVEYQTPGGTWCRLGDCHNHPASIKTFFESQARSDPNRKKMRAIDAQTKQLVDMFYA